MVVGLDARLFEPDDVGDLAFCCHFGRRREGAASRGAGSYGVEDFSRPVGQPLREISARLGGPQHSIACFIIYYSSIEYVRVIRVVVTLDTGRASGATARQP